MTVSSSEEFRNSARLHWFLFIFRFTALIIGLFLTDLNRPNASPHVLDLPGVPKDFNSQLLPVTIFMFVYHFSAGMYSFRCGDKKFSSYLLIFADAITGMIASVFMGSSYFYLGFVLPALESALLLGNTGFFFFILFPGVIYGVMIGGEFFFIRATEDPEKTRQLTALITSLQVMTFSSLVMLWAFKLAVGGEEENVELRKKANEEKNLILMDSQNDARTIQGLSNELVQHKDLIDKLETQVQDLKNELESSYKRFHDAKQQGQASEELFKQKEKEMSQMCEKRLKEAEKDIELTKKKLTKVQALLECFHELNKSLNPEEAYMSIVEHLLKIIPAQTCILFIVETIEGQAEIFAEVAYSPYSDYFRNFSLRMGEGVPGIVAERQKPVKIDNGSIVVDGIEMQTLLTYEKSAIVAPILYEEEILGVIYLGRPENFGFTIENIEFLVSFANIAAVTLQNAQLFQKTIAGGMYDDITGLYNAIYFNERFSEEVKRSNRYKTTLSLMLIDIDNFTRVNDEYGSEWGDNLLKEVSEIIRAHSRETDVIARIQSDEFAVLLLQSDKSSAVLISERIRMAVEMRSIARAKKTKIHSSLSIGVANFPTDATSKEDLIAKVEEALETAKKKGGNNTSYPSS